MLPFRSQERRTERVEEEVEEELEEANDKEVTGIDGTVEKEEMLEEDEAVWKRWMGLMRDCCRS
jgi:hypothetical protein